MSRSESIEGFVLAGGRSSRMGSDKAFLKFGDRTFLDNAVGILRPVCEKVTVVLNRRQADFASRISENLPCIFDLVENRGAIGGIHSALKHCRSEFALILACDMPLITSDAIEKLAGIALGSNGFAAFVPLESGGRVQPLSSVYRVTSCVPKLEEILLKGGSVSVRDFLETIEVKTIMADVLSSNKRMFANMNSPKDLERMNELGPSRHNEYPNAEEGERNLP